MYWCRVLPTTMWAKVTYKTSYFKHIGIFVRLALLVLGVVSCVAQMWEPKLGSQNFHI